jgi:hypothetical protein
MIKEHLYVLAVPDLVTSSASARRSALPPRTATG